MVYVRHRSYILIFPGTFNKVCVYMPILFMEIKICMHPVKYICIIYTYTNVFTVKSALVLLQNTRQ